MIQDEILREIDHRIAEAELRSATLAAEVTALARADGDSTERVERLWRTMDDLGELRRQRWVFDLLGRPDRAPPEGSRR